mgnify:CR=1 FL=1
MLLPSLITALIFFAAALLTGVAPPLAILSSFWANATMLIFGGLIVALLVIRTLLGPRPRRLSIQLWLVAAMIAANVFPSSLALAGLTMAAGLALVALAIPAPRFFQYTIALFWLMAFSSATHDIAADGFYMLGLKQHQQAAFVGIGHRPCETSICRRTCSARLAHASVVGEGLNGK